MAQLTLVCIVVLILLLIVEMGAYSSHNYALATLADILKLPLLLIFIVGIVVCLIFNL
jgi:hypothetical protein